MQATVHHPIAFAAMPSETAFSIGNISFYWQGVLLALAVLVILLFTHLETRRRQLPADTTIDLCLVLIPCGLIGARLWFVFANYADFADSFPAMLRFWDGGLSLYGAILFAAVGLLLYALKKKLSPAHLLDTLAPGLIAACAIVRWSDFFTQTGFGPEVTDKAQMWFPLAVLIEKTDTIHYALFFYEFLFCTLVFLFLWFVVRKHAKRNGSAFLWAALLYCCGHAARDALLFQQPETHTLRIVLLVCAGLAALLLLIQSKRPLPAQAADPGIDSVPDSEPAAEDSVSAAAEGTDPTPEPDASIEAVLSADREADDAPVCAPAPDNAENEAQSDEK